MSPLPLGEGEGVHAGVRTARPLPPVYATLFQDTSQGARLFPLQNHKSEY